VNMCRKVNCEHRTLNTCLFSHCYSKTNESNLASWMDVDLYLILKLDGIFCEGHRYK